MKIYINGTSCISAQPTFNNEGLAQPLTFNGNRLNCIEPEYNTVLEARLLRRMSRIMKMGLATAINALNKSNNPTPDAIITGTGFGCLEDTGSFLSKMSDPENRMMNPTAFIQSTHNTVGSQIALHLGNKGYNNTFTHSGFSFENALDDAILLLKNNDAQSVLIGGIDELTNTLFHILGRMQAIRKEPVQNTSQASINNKGYVAGEGSSFFVLSNTPLVDDAVVISDYEVLYKPQKEQLVSVFERLKVEEDSQLVLLGKNGDSDNDKAYEWIDQLSGKKNVSSYKHLCGEYPTASSFGLWFAVETIRGNNAFFNAHGKTASMLIYNCFNNDYHSFIRLSKC
jgi:3-oxoacyl-[acyl-carrier-protein] synthase II